MAGWLTGGPTDCPSAGGLGGMEGVGKMEGGAGPGDTELPAQSGRYPGAASQAPGPGGAAPPGFSPPFGAPRTGSHHLSSGASVGIGSQGGEATGRGAAW